MVTDHKKQVVSSMKGQYIAIYVLCSHHDHVTNWVNGKGEAISYAPKLKHYSFE